MAGKINQTERRKVTELLQIEQEVQKLWDSSKAFEADAADTSAFATFFELK